MKRIITVAISGLAFLACSSESSDSALNDSTSGFVETSAQIVKLDHNSQFPQAKAWVDYMKPCGAKFKRLEKSEKIENGFRIVSIKVILLESTQAACLALPARTRKNFTVHSDMPLKLVDGNTDGGGAQDDEAMIKKAKQQYGSQILKIKGTNGHGISNCTEFWQADALGEASIAVVPREYLSLMVYFQDKAALASFAATTRITGDNVVVRDQNGAEIGKVKICGKYIGTIVAQ